MQIVLPKKVNKIIRTLQDAGYEAYAVGGCVRDSLLGKTPNDWDITTSADPYEVKSLFRRTFDTGIKHGTVTVLMGNDSYEVTTYRIDGLYEDSRHPKEVTFTSDLKEDLLRRDFTINAMAYNESAGLVDEFNGLKDLENGTIRAVGNARERFSEDALRILRALRFSAQLDYEIEDGTREAIRELAPTLSNISAERIRTELMKLLGSDHPDNIRDGYELGITRVILPEFDLMMETPQNTPYHSWNAGEHTLRAIIEAVKEDHVFSQKDMGYIRLALLFHDMGKPASRTTDENGRDHFYGHPEKSEEIARDIMKRLKFDNETIKKVCPLVRYHDTKPKLTPYDIRKFMVRVGPELMDMLFVVKRADMNAHSDYRRDEREAYEKGLEAACRETVENGDCLSLKELAVNGKDLIGAGLKPGKAIGDALEAMLEYVLKDPSRNSKEKLMQFYFNENVIS